MHLLSLLTTFFVATTALVFGSQHTCIVQDVDSNQLLIQEGDLSSPLSPYSTFKIFLSLVGFDSTLLEDSENPLLPYQEEYKMGSTVFLEKWEAPHNPTSWIQNSCVWYSQLLTQKLGMNKLANYVHSCGYGNQNLIGDAGQANGLTRAWLGSSLRISPLEQVHFINRLVKQELPFSLRAHELTQSILFVEILPNGMALYGKTGSGDYAKGRQEPELKVGWFVGWIEKGDKKLACVYMIQGTETDGQITGPAARELLKQKLLQLR